jgi:hypothetical protein
MRVPCHECGSQNCGHVQIVSAGVHDGNIVAGVVVRMNFAGVGQTRFFFDGQGIEFSTKQDGGSRSVFHDGDNSRAAYMFGDVVAEGAEAGR